MPDLPSDWILCDKHGWAGVGGTCPYCDDGGEEMWKRLDDLSTSEPHARLRLATLGLWTYLLPASDSKGRMEVNLRLLVRRCLPLRDDVTEQAMGEALDEMMAAGAVHGYFAGDKRYIVFHEHEKHLPPGALRYKEPEGPEPPGNLCPCLSRQESGEKAPPVPSPSPSSESHGSLGLLVQRARAAKIPGRLDTIRSYLEAWVARTDAGRVEQVLMEPWTRGKTVVEIQDHFFGKDQGGKSWKDLIGGK